MRRFQVKMLPRQGVACGALLLCATLAAPASAKADKVAICHVAGPQGKVLFLEVSQRAADAHLAHGDRVLAGGDCVRVQDVIPACIIPSAGEEVLVDFNPLLGEFYQDSSLYARLSSTATQTRLTIYDGDALHDVATNSNWDYSLSSDLLVTQGTFEGTLATYRVADVGECVTSTEPPPDGELE